MKFRCGKPTRFAVTMMVSFGSHPKWVSFATPAMIFEFITCLSKPRILLLFGWFMKMAFCMPTPTTDRFSNTTPFRMLLSWRLTLPGNFWIHTSLSPSSWLTGKEGCGWHRPSAFLCMKKLTDCGRWHPTKAFILWSGSMITRFFTPLMMASDFTIRLISLRVITLIFLKVRAISCRASFTIKG